MKQRIRKIGLVSALVLVGGCLDGDDVERATHVFNVLASRPTVAPVMLNEELPFRYPAALYAQRVQGNVYLRLFIDREGKVLPESTVVAEPSGYPSLDSAAVRGAQDLYFEPAKTRSGDSVSVAVLYPVFFRHPQADPLPGDTILQRGPTLVPPQE
jgi:TonB family protein